MIDESKWINDIHGMELYPMRDFKGKRYNENGILFLCQYYLLKEALGVLTDGDINRFYQICRDLRTYGRDGTTRFDGLFDRGAGESNSDVSRADSISHDNLTAISAFSFLKKLPFAKGIAKHGIDNKMIFDNTYPENPRLLYKDIFGRYQSRLQHPRDWHYWLYNGGYKLTSFIFYPIFFISNILTCFTSKQETSGKMLMFTRLFLRKELHYKLLFKICSFILSKKYGKNWLSWITRIYYHQRVDNPIRILAIKVEEEGLI